MKHPGLYNPCNDGYAAKAWECLRRNEAFKKISANLSAALDADDAKEIYYDAINGALNEGNRVAFETIGQGSVWGLERVWPDISAKARRKFEALFEPSEPAIDLYPSFKGAQLKAAIIRADDDRIKYCHDFLILLVPRFVRDTNHRNALKKQFDEEILPQAVPNARLLKGSGRILGGDADWQSYLLYEQWQQLGYGLDKATQLIAWERYGKEKFNFGRTPEKRRKRAEEKLEDELHPSKWVGRVVDQIRVVERSIESVFPQFSPYDPGL